MECLLRYAMDGPEFESQGVQVISIYVTPRSALTLSQRPILWVPGLVPGGITAEARSN
jgi:hypothetical protein